MLRLPRADDPEQASATIENVLDLYTSDDGDTLWAVSSSTLYRYGEGVLFASGAADVPAHMRSIAVVELAPGDEAILIDSPPRGQTAAR